jgi:prolyl oligopeptidase
MKRSQPGAHSVLAAWLSALTTVTAVAQPPTPAAAPEADDPYRWLEDVQGERALAWVRQRKAESLALLQARPEYAAIRDGTLALLQSADKLPRIERHGDFFHNLWTDAANPRGLLRRTRLAGYRGPQPQWEFVLDIDALGRAENENRVFEGMDCLAPQARRCMLRLSRGGTDAVVAREFETRRKAFVPGGFMLPEAKLRLDWRDADTLVVGSDFGTGTITRSGYPRIARLWRRGTPLAQARTLFEGSADDVSASAWVDGPVQPVRMLARRAIDTWHGEVSPQRADGSWQRIETPPHASVYTQGPWLFVQPRQAWAVGEATHPAGSLLVTRLDAFLRCERRLQALFTPSATTFLSGYVVTQRHVIVNRLDNVAGRSVEWSMPQGQQCTWRQRALALVSAQSQGSIEVTRWAQPGTRHDALAHAYSIDYQGFLTPATRLLAQAGGDRRDLLKRAPARFDGAGLRSEQRFATSADGTRVGYFVVHPQGPQASPPRPTLLYGYGGFRQSQTPWYGGTWGQAWLARGGTVVVANIRGGSEYGPAWHRRRSRPIAKRATTTASPSPKTWSRAASPRRRNWVATAAATAACSSPPWRCSARHCSAPSSAPCRCSTCGATTGCSPAPRGWANTATPTCPTRGPTSSSTARTTTSAPERPTHACSSPPAHATTACTPPMPARWWRACRGRATRRCASRTPKAATAALPT